MIINKSFIKNLMHERPLLDTCHVAIHEAILVEHIDQQELVEKSLSIMITTWLVIKKS